MKRHILLGSIILILVILIHLEIQEKNKESDKEVTESKFSSAPSIRQSETTQAEWPVFLHDYFSVDGDKNSKIINIPNDFILNSRYSEKYIDSFIAGAFIQESKGLMSAGLKLLSSRISSEQILAGDLYIYYSISSILDEMKFDTSDLALNLIDEMANSRNDVYRLLAVDLLVEHLNNFTSEDSKNSVLNIVKNYNNEYNYSVFISSIECLSLIGNDKSHSYLKSISIKNLNGKFPDSNIDLILDNALKLSSKILNLN